MIDHDTLVEMVRAAACEVFTTMLGSDIQAAEAYTGSAAPLSNHGVVSLIGLAGSWVGTGSISCSAPFACRIASQLMMSEYSAVDDEVLDAVAEITNMIIGNVKTTLEEKLGPMGLSIPTVIYGRNFSSRTVGKQEWTIVPFTSDGEKLDIQLCLAPNRESSRLRLAVAGHEPVEV